MYTLQYSSPRFVEIGPPVPEIFEGFFTIYGHGGHLGHVTWNIYVHIGSPSYRCFISNLALRPSGFRQDSLTVMVIILTLVGGRPAPGVRSFLFCFFQNHKSSVHLPISFKFFP